MAADAALVAASIYGDGVGYPLTGGRRAPAAVAELADRLDLDQDRAYEIVVWLLQEAGALDAAAQVDRLLWALRQGLPVEVAIGNGLQRK